MDRRHALKGIAATAALGVVPVGIASAATRPTTDMLHIFAPGFVPDLTPTTREFTERNEYRPDTADRLSVRGPFDTMDVLGIGPAWVRATLNGQMVAGVFESCVSGGWVRFTRPRTPEELREDRYRHLAVECHDHRSLVALNGIAFGKVEHWVRKEAWVTESTATETGNPWRYMEVAVPGDNSVVIPSGGVLRLAVPPDASYYRAQIVTADGTLRTLGDHTFMQGESIDPPDWVPSWPP